MELINVVDTVHCLLIQFPLEQFPQEHWSVSDSAPAACLFRDSSLHFVSLVLVMAEGESRMVLLKRRRGSIKSRVTRIRNLLDRAEGEDSALRLGQKLESIPGLRKDLIDLKHDFQNLPSDVDVEDHLNQLDDLEEDVDDVEIKLKIRRSKLGSEPRKCTDPTTEPAPTVSKRVDFKLPEISLPQFWGRCEEFLSFKTQFNSIVGDNKSLSDFQKLHYLKSCLKGDARIETNEDSFRSLMKALESRFENKRTIIDAHLGNILNFEVISNECPQHIRRFVDLLNKTLRSLKSLNYEGNKLSDALLLNVCLKKLSTETRRAFEFSLASTEVPSLDDFVTFLDKRTVVLEGLARSGAPFPKHQFQKPVNSYTKTHLVHSGSRKLCFLCKEQIHPLYRCSRFRSMDVPSRFSFVKKQKLCLGCFKPGHIVAKCRSVHFCANCNSKTHNTLLHRKHAPSCEQLGSMLPGIRLDPKVESLEPADLSSFDPEEIGRSAGDLHSRGSTEETSSSVLLSTVKVYCESGSGSPCPLRALLDTGSMNNFITIDAAASLGLRRQKVGTRIYGINGSSQYVTSKVVTRVFNRDKTFSRDIELLAVPEITGFLPSSDLDVSCIDVPGHIELSDETFHRPGGIDMLIGNEFFFEIVGGDKILFFDGKFILQDTVFGFTAGGVLNNRSSGNTYYGAVTALNKDIGEWKGRRKRPPGILP